MYLRALLLTALAYAVTHHLGLLPDGLGAGPEGTQWADWLDLLVPWLVLVPAAVTLHAAGVAPRVWAAFGVGAVAYASGHGIHLAANSVHNAAPGETAHLWDEVVGHHLWFVGVALVFAAVAASMAGRPRVGLLGHLAALAVGLTWATNAVGGGTEVFSLLVGATLVGFGWRQRRGLSAVLLTGFGVAVVFLAVAVASAALAAMMG
jgi:hypothetical protein